MVTTSWWVLVSWQQVQRHCPACASMEYLQMHGPQDLPIYPDCPLLVSRGSGDSGQFPERSGLLILARTALWATENPHLPLLGPSLSQTSSSNLWTMADPSSGNLPWAIQPGPHPSSCLFCLGSQLAVAWVSVGWTLPAALP